MMPYIADAVRSQTGWEIVFTVGGLSYGSLRPVLILTPILAQTIAKAGWSKADVKRYLYDHARMAAWRVEAFTEKWADFRIGSLQRQVNRSEEHTSELQSLMRISYAVFCLKKKNKYKCHKTHIYNHNNTLDTNHLLY